ncbi:hypothetical protein RB2083_1321 [Rhodobacteraceae bacterium HTCC2083]|nr:hypothetical protein RB2083_1321 [Rhodobacteraceae bacterium HTCC2083]
MKLRLATSVLHSPRYFPSRNRYPQAVIVTNSAKVGLAAA